MSINNINNNIIVYNEEDFNKPYDADGSDNIALDNHIIVDGKKLKIDKKLKNHFKTLPIELVCEIINALADSLTQSELLELRLVSKQFQAAIDDQLLRKPWLSFKNNSSESDSIFFNFSFEQYAEMTEFLLMAPQASSFQKIAKLNELICTNEHLPLPIKPLLTPKAFDQYKRIAINSLRTFWGALPDDIKQHLENNPTPERIKLWMDVHQEKLEEITDLDLSIYLTHCRLMLPPEIKYLKNLKTLDFMGSCIGEISKELKNLKQLTKLNLSDNFLSDKSIKSLENLTQLTELDLRSNKIREIPKKLQRLIDSGILKIFL